MIKTFCDKCEVEITKENDFSRAEVEVGGLSIITHFNPKEPIEESQAVCKYCVFDAINKLDDRPRESQGGNNV